MNTQIIIERFNEYASQGDVFCQEMLKEHVLEFFKHLSIPSLNAHNC